MIIIDYMYKKQENNIKKEDIMSAKDKLHNYRYLLKNITKDTMNLTNNNIK